MENNKEELDQKIKEFLNVRNTGGDFARENGMIVTKAEGGCAIVEMEVEKRHLNPIGSIHGGCIFTLADSASGTAVYSMEGCRSTSIDANIHYLRPGIGKTHIYAEAHVIKKGKNVVVTEVTVKDQDDNELAMGIYTNMILH